ncbi:hypothetical protein V3C99_009543 [Haemonchus contortus]
MRTQKTPLNPTYMPRRRCSAFRGAFTVSNPGAARRRMYSERRFLHRAGEESEGESRNYTSTAAQSLFPARQRSAAQCKNDQN